MTQTERVQGPLFVAVVGPVLYLVIWLLILPMVADTSTRLAVLTLMLSTGVYCYSIAHLKGRNQAAWAAFGILAGTIELGILHRVAGSSPSVGGGYFPPEFRGKT